MVFLHTLDMKLDGFVHSSGSLGTTLASSDTAR